MIKELQKGHYEMPDLLQQFPEANNSFCCPHCPFSTLNKTELMEHVLNHSSVSYICPFCLKFCNLKQNLKRHMLVHIEIRPFVCSICKKSYTLKSVLKRHMNKHLRFEH